MHVNINYCQIWIINRGKDGILLICRKISRITYFLGWREYSGFDYMRTIIMTSLLGGHGLLNKLRESTSRNLDV